MKYEIASIPKDWEIFCFGMVEMIKQVKIAKIAILLKKYNLHCYRCFKAGVAA